MGQIIKLIDSNTKENVNFEEVLSWWDGTAMDDSKVDNVIYRKKGHVYYRRQNNNVFDVEIFGAVGDGVTDDTLAIQKACDILYLFSSYGSGTHNKLTLNLRSPNGYVITNKVTCRNINFNCESVIRYKGNSYGTAIEFNNLRSSNVNIAITGDLPLNANSDTQGIVFLNCMNSTINIRSCFLFKRGIIFLADGNGCAWNDVYLGFIGACMDSFVIKSLNNGWPNANSVHGGSFNSYTGYITVDTISQQRNFIKFESDGSYGAHSWNFYNSWFEGGTDLSKFNGYETVVLYAPDQRIYDVNIINCRIEQVNSNKIGIVQRASTVSIETSDWIAGEIESRVFTILNTDGTIHNVNIDKVLHAPLVKSNNLKDHYKVIDNKYYVRGLETWDYFYGYNGNPSTIPFIGALIKVDIDSIVYSKTPRRVRYFLFDSNFELITDDAILNEQKGLISGAFPNYIASYNNTKSILTSADELVTKSIIQPVEGVSYIFICAEPRDWGIIEVDVAKNTVGQSTLFIKNPEFFVDKEAYVIPSTIESLNGIYSDFNVGDKFYSKANNCIYTITQSDEIGITYHTKPLELVQANSTATDVPTLVSDFNSLLAKLRSSGLLSQ